MITNTHTLKNNTAGIKKLAIITTHPIQYNAPLFQLLSSRKKVEVHVFYTWGSSVLENKFDPGFGKKINWDIPLLQGYEFTFLHNTSAAPGSHHFRGIDNSDIIEKVTEWQPDAILVYGWAFKSHLKVMKEFKNKVPILFRGDSTLLDGDSIFKWLIKISWLRYVYKFIDFALYTGTDNYKYFQKFGVKKSQLISAPHAIDNNRFRENACNPAINFRDTLKIKKEDFIFLFAGKLESKKNPQILIQAFKNFSLYNSVHLVIVGNGHLEANLKLLSSSVPNIHFLPFQNQKAMPSVYAMADAFILPSKGPGETWGLAVNEAMATGLPSIVSNKCGCAKDLIIENKTGFSFPSGDEKALTDAMILTLESGGKLKMSKNCLDHVQKFTLENIAVQIETLLEKITPGKETLQKIRKYA